MKVLIIAGYTPSLIKFRGNLIQDMVKEGHEVVTIAPEEGYEKEIKELGAEFIQLDFNRTGSNPIKDLMLIFKIRKVVKKIQPDLVFSYTIKPVIYGSLGAKLAGVKHIYSMVTGLGHAFMGVTLKQKVVGMIAKTLYKIGLLVNKKVIFQNQDDIDEFVNLHLVSNNKCKLVSGSGVDLKRFQASELPEKPVFLMICRLLKEKGVIEYLEAAKIVKQKYPKAIFKLVGPFDKNPSSLKEDELKSYIADGSIEYLGEMADVRPAIKDALVYVLPSYREGTPRTVLEAMAMGRAILTTGAPGCKETVKEGINGYMVPVKDIKALADKMEWFIEHPVETKQMGQASLEYCKERYDVNKVNQDMLNIMKL